MFESVQRQHTVGRLAWAGAWVGLVVGQLHALARHNTADGKGDLKLPLTRLWSDPARSALRPLLDWANPDTVYLTYGKVWVPVFVVFTLCAVVVHHRRRPAGFERWGWRVALTGYVGVCVGAFLDYYTQWTGYLPDSVSGPMFGETVLALLVTLVGSTLLGVALLRNGFRPRLTAWLLTLAFPLAIGIMQVTSLGNVVLPVVFAFGLAGRNLARERVYTQVVGAPVGA